MTVEEVNIFITEEVGRAEESQEDILVRLYLSNSESIEIWFDKESDCYTWSNASYGYEDTFAVVSDIWIWMEDNNLSVIDMEVV